MIRVAVILLVMLAILTALIIGVVFVVRKVIENKNSSETGDISLSLHAAELIPSYVVLDSENVYAAYFTAPSAFSGIEVYGATVGDSPSVKVTIYSFDTDYFTSVSSSNRKFSISFSDYPDKSWLFASFKSLPAGNYIVVVSSSSTGGAYYSSMPAENSASVFFKNGEPWSGGALYCNILLNR